MNMNSPIWISYFPLVSTIFGLVLGSFYNVCIHRYLGQISIVSPGSHCPQCGHALSWWENIPLLSYAFLRGACRECRQAISLRYPLVESISGLWALLLALKFGFGWEWLVYLAFGGILIIISFIDLDSFILPDLYTIPGSVCAFLCASLWLPLGWQASLIGALAGGGGFWLIQKGYKALKGIQGLGSGDIKLMFLLGALLGWQALPIMIFISAISGLAVSVFYLLKKDSQGLQTAIPFGPFLSLGGMIYILCGREIWSWYLV
ncbi:MAG: prepilin peptidase [Desulfohalobiaceae bacterium]|nr:prepilin peptidase [Desulfohalobiaceae bacterium]